MTRQIPFITFPSRPHGHGIRSVPLVITGQKTTQWRIIRPQPPADSTFVGCAGGMSKFDNSDGSGWFTKPPYKVGDVAYVRETWSMDADGNFLFYDDRTGHPENGWKRAITMPPQAARLFVRITGIRAVRLHDLTRKDVAMEGLGELTDMAQLPHIWTEYMSSMDIANGGHWRDNPWLWVIRFKTCGKPKGMEAQYWDEESIANSMQQTYRNKYEIRIRATGELVAEGTAEMCAEKLGRTTHAIYDMVRKSKNNEKYLYLVTRANRNSRPVLHRKKGKG